VRGSNKDGRNMSNDPVARFRNEALEKAAPELAGHAEAIRKLGKRVVNDVIEIGERLSKARSLIAHGHWLRWLEDELGWSDETARRFMSVFEMNKIHKLWDSELPISVLYQLAAPRTPPEARDDIIERSKEGERLSLANVKETIAKAKASEPPFKITMPGPASVASAVFERIESWEGFPNQLSNADVAEAGERFSPKIVLADPPISFYAKAQSAEAPRATVTLTRELAVEVAAQQVVAGFDQVSHQLNRYAPDELAAAVVKMLLADNASCASHERRSVQNVRKALAFAFRLKHALDHAAPRLRPVN
jgi:hypothetical protein